MTPFVDESIGEFLPNLLNAGLGFQESSKVRASSRVGVDCLTQAENLFQAVDLIRAIDL